MDLRRARVIVETERHRILGSVALPREGYRSRLTDFLNAAERDFLALTDVVMNAIGTFGQAWRKLRTRGTTWVASPSADRRSRQIDRGAAGGLTC